MICKLSGTFFLIGTNAFSCVVPLFVSLSSSRPTYDSKNPYAAPITVSRELFEASADRHCLHMEIDISGSGITYQAGDHVAIWPVNAEREEIGRASCRERVL